MSKRFDTCAHCSARIYLNTRPDRQVDRWVHADTGAMYCSLAEDTWATPKAEEHAS